MHLRCFWLSLIAFLLFSLSSLAENAAFVSVPDTIHPGKSEPLTLSISADCTLSLKVLDQSGAVCCTLRENWQVSAGNLVITYNGCDSMGQPLSEGIYILRLYAGQESYETSLHILAPAPQLSAVALAESQGYLGQKLSLSFTASTDGQLSLLLIQPSGAALPYQTLSVQGGSNALSLDTSAEMYFSQTGDYLLSVTLTDAAGLSSNASQVRFSLSLQPTPTPAPIVRPSQVSTETIPGDYWSMEVGTYDWEAIWQVMISPMTIIKGSGKEAEKQVYRLRATPDSSTKSSNIVGEITCETQGVHVLETLDSGWTLVEAYNSSYGPNNTNRRGYGNTDDLIQGYVETSRLATFTPKTQYGLLVDKLTQELYIVTENGLFTTLQVSTGNPTSSQPWNETPSGEFYLSSKMGDFPSGNMTCAYGMRFNCGDVLHEVPYILNEKYDLKDYSSTEKYLGEKASHGCIRVQRKANSDGVNMRWIWDNVPLGTKFLIWDDSCRPISYPMADDELLYYNPDGGQYYHSDQNCSSIKARYLPLQGSFSYAELDNSENQRFKPCPYCNPPQRKSEIDALNAANGF